MRRAADIEDGIRLVPGMRRDENKWGRTEITTANLIWSITWTGAVTGACGGGPPRPFPEGTGNQPEPDIEERKYQ